VIVFTLGGAYLLLIVFFIFEGRLRQGEAARSREAGQHDQGSTNYVGAAFGLSMVCLLLAPLLDYFKLASLIPPALTVAGLALAAGGLALRLWAPRVLGQYYTRTLRVAEQQTVVDAGPYHYIRHPGYAGLVTLWIGAGLASGNLLVAVVIALAMFTAYAYRIRAEEVMLAATLGQAYRDYQKRTKRLIPFIY